MEATMPKRLIAWLLYLANSDPPFICRQEFYALKERLLRKHGRMDGQDVQHIRKDCWTCEATGTHPVYKDRCRKCGGTGVYEDAWILLRRWEFMGRIFHIPEGRTTPRLPADIEGYVRHANHGRAPREAILWLFLLCDWPAFWRLLFGQCSASRRWYPLLNLQCLAFEARLAWDRYKPRRCRLCKRWTIQPGYQWPTCRKCEAEQVKLWQGINEEIPF